MIVARAGGIDGRESRDIATEKVADSAFSTRVEDTPTNFPVERINRDAPYRPDARYHRYFHRVSARRPATAIPVILLARE